MKRFLIAIVLVAMTAAPLSARDRLPGWRIRRAADNAATAAANANRLVLDAQRTLDEIQAQGDVEVEVDLTVKPPELIKDLLVAMGFDGKVTLRIKLPGEVKPTAKVRK